MGKIDNRDKLNVLQLARWYPNRYDPMFGLFIQRHIKTVLPWANTALVYAQAVSDSSLKQKYEMDYTSENGFLEIRVYYREPYMKIPLISFLQKNLRFYKANSIGIKYAKRQLGNFELLHIHILSRLGFIALYFKWFHRKPFVITEHWSRYLSINNAFTGFGRKCFTKLVVKNAEAVTTVTQNLSDAMKKHRLKNKHYFVIHNVVDSVFFKEYLSSTSIEKVFIHISCFEDKSKNISGILRSIKALSEMRQDFRFVMIGTGKDFDALKRYAKQLKIADKILVFKGLLEGEMLANEMAKADMLVVFSNYENMPVVINESLALGLPVLATSVGGISEIIDNTKGILIDSHNEKALTESLNSFLNGKISFDTIAIKKFARNMFSSQTIGRYFAAIYYAVFLSKNKS